MDEVEGAPPQPEVKPAAAPPARPRQTAKSIVLFSDGTGNSSAKLFKTNVWRMYEAVDLGPPEEGERKQIAFYDDGVGTSGFKPLAVLGGVFGVGLKRNVLDIYRYACRNFRPAPGQKPGDEAQDGGDHIYGFGFSRGAFTMRTAIALIAQVGLVETTDEAELDRRVEDAWRAYRSYAPRRRWAPLNIWRRISHGGLSEEDIRREAMAKERARNLHPVIRFVGVWDTVAAYGGPVTEIVEAIDNWIVRLSMPNYRLAPAVRRARHALSIDDERDAFHPLLWDEVHEERLIGEADRAKTPWLAEGRLEQVWFTGMHADVGGGYPDESLSYVSFLWMMEQAKEADLRAAPVMLDRFHALASSDGPIHDSRAGVGSYYRYQPRRIAAWVEPTDSPLLVRRHPDLKTGLIRSVKIHESVAARIATGTDRYAPIALPACLEVVPPQREGENAPPPTEESESGKGLKKRPRLPLISDALHKRFEHPGWNAARVKAMRPIWLMVERRRVVYFVSLCLTLALVLMPVWDNWAPAPYVLASGHGLVGRMIAALGAFLPGFLVGVVESWASQPLYPLVLVAGLIVTNGYASRLERKLRDDTRKIWNGMIELTVTEAPKVEPAKQDGSEPTLKRFLRWRLVPLLIFVAMIVVAAWLLLAMVARISLAFQERGSTLCPAASPIPAEKNETTFTFDTRSACHRAGLTVRRDRRYAVEMVVREGWQDGKETGDPRGIAADRLGFAGYLGIPLRRAVGAGYLQPVVHIRGGAATPSIRPLRLEQSGAWQSVWRGEFVADRTGELSLFANEAVLPFKMFGRPTTVFYTHETYGNRGVARVTIRAADTIVSPGAKRVPRAR